MAKTTIPTKNNIDFEQGALLLSVSDFKDSESMHLITLGEVHIQMKVSAEETSLSLVEGETVLSSIEVSNEPLDILINWEDKKVWLNVFTQDVIPTYIGATEKVEISNLFNEYISLFEGVFFNGVYESITSYGNTLNQSELSAFSLEVFKETTEVLFVADFSQPTHYQKNVVIEDTFAPIDGSPILLSDDKGPLQRQYFFDEITSEYKNEVVETFTYSGEKKKLLAYENIEPTFKIKVAFQNPEKDVFFTGDKVGLDGQYLLLNLTNEDIEVLYGYDYKVTYQLERSYNVEFNEDVPHDGFKINLVNMKPEIDGQGHYSSTENVRMIREGNRFEQQYLAKEIELNPLINPQVQGFMYIDKDPQETNAFRISISSQYLVGNGVDTASVMVEAIDSEGNEVLSPYLSVYLMDSYGKTGSGFGSIEPVIGYASMKARNTSGRAYYELRAPILTDDKVATHKIFVVAHDRKTGVSAQYPMYIRSTTSEQVIQTTTENKNYLNVPFEYFSRYFDRDIRENETLRVFDVNKNGRLDREDLKEFSRVMQDRSTAMAITEKLLEEEQIKFEEE